MILFKEDSLIRSHKGLRLIVLGLCFFVISFNTLAVDSSINMSSSGAPVAQVSELEKIDKKEAKKLRREFQKKLRLEREAYILSERQAWKQSELGRQSSYKEWIEKEKQERRKFFEDNPKGSDRRHYVKEMMKRRDDFLKTQRQESQAQKQSLKDKRKVFESEQKKRRIEYNGYLDRLQRPPSQMNQ